jgi:NADPH:quinone reductase-like Zn-dependent oxidoreductase
MSTRAEYAAVMALIFAGKLKPVIDRAFPLAEIRAAHEYLDNGQVLGKIVLAI